MAEPETGNGLDLDDLELVSSDMAMASVYAKEDLLKHGLAWVDGTIVSAHHRYTPEEVIKNFPHLKKPVEALVFVHKRHLEAEEHLKQRGP